MSLVTPYLMQMPTLLEGAESRAQARFLEFFAANIRNRHARRAYVLV
jgi:hypothetical protein